MNRDDTLALWAKCQAAKRAALEALAESGIGPEAREGEAQKAAAEVWNEWGWGESELPEGCDFSGVRFRLRKDINEALPEAEAKSTAIAICEGKEIDFSEFACFGLADFSNAIFEAPLRFFSYHFDGLVDGLVSFKKACFESAAQFTVFGGNVDFSEAVFRDKAGYSHCPFYGAANFRSTLFEGGADFRSASFDKTFSFENAVFQKPPDFDRARFDDRASYEKSLAYNKDLFANSTNVDGPLSRQLNPEGLSGPGVDKRLSFYINDERIERYEIERYDKSLQINWKHGIVPELFPVVPDLRIDPESYCNFSSILFGLCISMDTYLSSDWLQRARLQNTPNNHSESGFNYGQNWEFDQNWEFGLWQEGDYIYCVVGDNVREVSIHIYNSWFRTPLDVYIAAWERAFAEAAERAKG